LTIEFPFRCSDHYEHNIRTKETGSPVPICKTLLFLIDQSVAGSRDIHIEPFLSIFPQLFPIGQCVANNPILTFSKATTSMRNLQISVIAQDVRSMPLNFREISSLPLPHHGFHPASEHKLFTVRAALRIRLEVACTTRNGLQWGTLARRFSSPMNKIRAFFSCSLKRHVAVLVICSKANNGVNLLARA